MFCGLIILNCTIKTRMIYFGAATEGIIPKNSFTLVLLVHVPYPTFPLLSSFKSFGFLIFPFFAIKLEMAFPYNYQHILPTFARFKFFYAKCHFIGDFSFKRTLNKNAHSTVELRGLSIIRSRPLAMCQCRREWV